MSARLLQAPRSSLVSDWPIIIRCMCPSMKPGRRELPFRSMVSISSAEEERAVVMGSSSAEPTWRMVSLRMSKAEAKEGGVCRPAFWPGERGERKMRPLVKRVVLAMLFKVLLCRLAW